MRKTEKKIDDTEAKLNEAMVQVDKGLIVFLRGEMAALRGEKAKLMDEKAALRELAKLPSLLPPWPEDSQEEWLTTQAIKTTRLEVWFLPPLPPFSPISHLC